MRKWFVLFGVLLFLWKNPLCQLFNPTFQGALLFIVSFIVLVVAHEFIHGLTWSMFSEHHFKDIDFGFMKEFFTSGDSASAIDNASSGSSI